MVGRGKFDEEMPVLQKGSEKEEVIVLTCIVDFVSVRLSAMCTSSPLLSRRVLVLISVRGGAKIGAVIQLEGVGCLKNPNGLIRNQTWNIDYFHCCGSSYIFEIKLTSLWISGYDILPPAEIILLKLDQYVAVSILGFSCTILNRKGTRSGTNVFSCYECGKVYYSNPILIISTF
jgi:hypothetical protein